MESPTVALDARLTRQMSAGMKAYARELTARLPGVAPDMRFRAFGRGENFSFAEQIALPLAIARARPSLTHYLSIYAPVLTSRPYVVTVHDLIHLRYPQFFKRRVVPYYRTAVRRLCLRAARVITDDERTIADLERFLSVDPRNVRVVALGADDAFFAAAEPHRAPRPYFLYAGNHREHKDLTTLARAWSLLPEDVPADLYVTGPDDLDGLRAQFSRASGTIVALGDVPLHELARYYAGATALVHAALYEGFGLPMLEAMAQRCPVVACSDAVPSVLRDAAYVFAPGDAQTAARAMRGLLIDANARERAARRAAEAASGLTWDRCARQTAQVYREVAAD